MAPETWAAEAAVFAAVLDSLAIRERAERLLVAEPTWTGLQHEGVAAVVMAAVAEVPGITATAAADFQTRNTSPRSLAEPPPAEVPVTVVSTRELEGLRGPDGGIDWQEFYARFPGSSGLLTLSRPGFDAGEADAVVLLERRCGVGCGTGWVFLLARRQHGWRIVEERVLWIS